MRKGSLLLAVLVVFAGIVACAPDPVVRAGPPARPSVAHEPPPSAERRLLELADSSTALSTAAPDITSRGAVLAPPPSPRRRTVPADRACAALADPGFTARCGTARSPTGDLLWVVHTRAEGRGFLAEVLKVDGGDGYVVLEAVDEGGTRLDRVGVAVADVSGDGSEEIAFAFYRRNKAQVLSLDLVQSPGTVAVHRDYVQGSARASSGLLEAWEAIQDRATGKVIIARETIQFRDGAWGRTSLTATGSNAVYGQDFPDPFILRDGHRYFGYSTNRGANIPVIGSDDLMNWHTLGDALPQLPPWSSRGRVWAPAVLPRPGRYVLYYTTRHATSGMQCLSVAQATSPQGPFVDDSTGPLVCQTDLGGSIDPSPFVDDTGAVYLLWKSEDRGYTIPSQIWSQPLSADGLSLVGSPTAVLTQDREWEKPTMEAPAMVSDGTGLYLFYSAGTWQNSTYAVGWARCSSPSGPCIKAGDRPLVAASADLSGPGGQEIVQTSDGRRWLAYHAWVPLEGGYPGSRRLLHIASLHFDATGPVVNGSLAIMTAPDR